MIKALFAPWSRSLGGRFLRPLVLGGTAAAAATAWLTYQAAFGQLEQQLEQRARLIAGMVNHAAMVSTKASALRHVLEDVLGAEPEVQAIVVTIKGPAVPPRILAAIDRAPADAEIERTPAAHVQADIRTAIEQGAFGRHPHPDGQRFVYIAPLAPHISQQVIRDPRAGRESTAHGGAKLDGLLTTKAYRGAIVLTLNRGRLDQAIAALMWRHLLALAAAIAITVLLAYVLLRRQVLGPMGAMGEVLRRREQDRPTGFAPAPAGDEIAELKYGLDRMLGVQERQQARLARFAAARAAVLRRMETVNERLHKEICARHRYQEELIAAKRQAELANRIRSEFLANMSHELRTPLNAITGFSQMMRSEMLGPIGNARYREYAEDIYASGRHLLDIINDVLDLAMAESAEHELHEQDLDVSEVIGAVRVMVWERAQRGGIELEVGVDDGLPMLRADERKLKQILGYLLSNAIKFTSAGGKVTLRGWRRQGRGHVFQISDTGIGIAPDDIPTALAPFRQIDRQINRRFEGTGLGLTLTKALVELHGGSLELKSQVGVGTLATVGLPAERIVRSPDRRPDTGTVVAMASLNRRTIAS
ncbi:MAG: sensor histidine kinase [Kiloniellales bacterium]